MFRHPTGQINTLTTCQVDKSLPVIRIKHSDRINRLLVQNLPLCWQKAKIYPHPAVAVRLLMFPDPTGPPEQSVPLPTVVGLPDTPAIALCLTSLFPRPKCTPSFPKPVDRHS